MSDDAEDELLQARGLPDPTLTFTLPSIHDGTTLDCRIYHPSSLSISPRATPWRRHAAIVAHPYAPLGGSWDDHIVDLVASTLLRLGYLVCTFNFRYVIHGHRAVLSNDGREGTDGGEEAQQVRQDGHHGQPRPSAPITCR